MEKPDQIDLKLLSLLQEEGNITIKELAKRVNLSSTPVFERVRRLEREGYIKKYIAVIDQSKMDQGFDVFCNIRLKKHSKEYIIHFTRAIKDVSEIMECYNISGDYDFMLKIHVSNMGHYQSFVENVLGTIESVGALHSLFVLKEIKHAYALPLLSEKEQI